MCIRDSHDRAHAHGAPGAGNVTARLGTVAGEHLAGHKKDEHDEEYLQERGGHVRGHKAAAEGAYKDAGCNLGEDVPVHGPALCVGTRARDGRDDNGGERRPESQLVYELRRIVEPFKDCLLYTSRCV